MTLTYQLLLSIILVVGITGAACALVSYWLRKQKVPFEMDPLGHAGAFLPIMERYLKLADGLMVLAIVTLGYIASPIILGKIAPYDPEHLGSMTLLNAWLPFVASFLYIFFFRIFLVVWYESYRHKKQTYTKFRYATIQALPIAAFGNLILGYAIIAFDVALWIHNGGGNVPSQTRQYY